MGLMRSAVVLPRLWAAVPKAPARCIGIACCLHIRRPLVTETGGGNGVGMMAPELAPETLNFFGEVSCLGDLDTQLSGR